MHEYDYKKIGRRIRDERKKAGYSRQEDFAEALGLSYSSRRTIGEWENGKKLPDMNDFFNMCKLFDCELGYLICEYDCKTRETADIHEETGLSTGAINKLRTINYESMLQATLEPLNQIIEHEDFINLLKSIYLYKMQFVNKKSSPSRELSQLLSKELQCSEDETYRYLDKISESTIFSILLGIINGHSYFKKKKNKQLISLPPF